MKKVLMALCALAFVFGCQEPEVTPDKPDGPDGPTGKGEFTLTSNAAVTVGAEHLQSTGLHPST